MPIVSASSRWTIRCASPAGVLARWRSRRIWHLRLEMVDSITSRSRPGLPLPLEVGGVACALGGEDRHLLQRERLGVLASPQAFVGDQGAAFVRSRELTHGLVLLLVGRDERVTQRQTVGVGDKDKPHAPQILALGRAIAVGGGAGKVAAARAAGVVGDPDQGAVGEPQLVSGDQ